MSATFEKLSNNQVKFSFVVPAEDFDKALKTAYAQTARRYNVPGFRRGKAPKHIIEMHYGANTFYESAFDIVCEDVCEKAIKEHNLELVRNPEFSVEQMEKGQELKFSFTAFTRADLSECDYKHLKARKFAGEVTEDDVEAEIERARERNSRFIEITDRPVKLDDQVNIDYEGFDGETQFEGGTAKGYELTIGSGSFVPGFEEQLIGANVGDELQVNVTFPEDYREKSLAGKSVTFNVKINGIREKEVPALDDDFARDMSFDTLDEYKTDVRETLLKRAEERADAAYENDIIKELIEIGNVGAYPDGTDRAIESMLRDMALRLAYQGMSLDDYCAYTGQNVDQLREMYREEAENRVKMEILIEAVREEQNIEATESEIDAQIALAAEARKTDFQKFKDGLKDNGREYYEYAANMQKTMDFLKTCAKSNEE